MHDYVWWFVTHGQLFLPATNNKAETASNKALCGPYVYTIDGLEQNNFMEIVPPSGD